MAFGEQINMDMSHVLDTGVQAIAESGDFEYLQHKSVVNHLDDDRYSLCFPPLTILSRLAISKTMSMEIVKELFFRDYQYAYCE